MRSFCVGCSRFVKSDVSVAEEERKGSHDGWIRFHKHDRTLPTKAVLCADCPQKVWCNLCDIDTRLDPNETRNIVVFLPMWPSDANPKSVVLAETGHLLDMEVKNTFTSNKHWNIREIHIHIPTT